jgi:hypothetical protein
LKTPCKFRDRHAISECCPVRAVPRSLRLAIWLTIVVGFIWVLLADLPSAVAQADTRAAWLVRFL